MARVFILAYGNPMRCDDGLAWHASDQLTGKFPVAEVEILRLHQLAPELSETIRYAEAVIFVDAASAEGSSPGEVRCQEVLPESTARFSHHLSPGAVLALARQLYGAIPRAYSVTLTGECFDHGESLSRKVAAALPALVGRIEILVRQFVASEAFPPASRKP